MSPGEWNPPTKKEFLGEGYSGRRGQGDGPRRLTPEEHDNIRALREYNKNIRKQNAESKKRYERDMKLRKQWLKDEEIRRQNEKEALKKLKKQQEKERKKRLRDEEIRRQNEKEALKKLKKQQEKEKQNLEKRLKKFENQIHETNLSKDLTVKNYTPLKTDVLKKTRTLLDAKIDYGTTDVSLLVKRGFSEESAKAMEVYGCKCDTFIESILNDSGIKFPRTGQKNGHWADHWKEWAREKNHATLFENLKNLEDNKLPKMQEGDIIVFLRDEKTTAYHADIVLYVEKEKGFALAGERKSGSPADYMRFKDKITTYNDYSKIVKNTKSIKQKEVAYIIRPKY